MTRPSHLPCFDLSNNNEPTDYASAIRNNKRDSREVTHVDTKCRLISITTLSHIATCRNWYFSLSLSLSLKTSGGQVTPHTAAVPTLRSTNYFLELLEEQLPLPRGYKLPIQLRWYARWGHTLHSTPRQGYTRICTAGEIIAGTESLAK